MIGCQHGKIYDDASLDFFFLPLNDLLLINSTLNEKNRYLFILFSVIFSKC